MKAIAIWSFAALLSACGTDAGGQYVATDGGKMEEATAPVDLLEQVDMAVVDVAEEMVPMPDLIPGEISEEEWATHYGEECPPDALVGLARVFLDGIDYQYVDAKIIDRVISTRVLLELETMGECRLLKRAAPECTPQCNQQSEQCSLDEECVPLEVQQDVGTFYVAGLNYDVAMKPNAANAYSQSWNWGWPAGDQIFDEGSPIAAHAGTGMYGPFTLHGHGVAPLKMVDPPKFVLKDEPLELNWEASDGPGEIFVQVSLQNHATTPVTIQCRGDDAGTTLVPSEYVNKLLEAYIEGTIAVTAQRRTVDAEHFKTGCIEFQVYSSWDADLGYDKPEE